MTEVPLAQRLWSSCPADEIESLLDLACQRCRRLKLAYGYLSMRAALLSNVSVLENLWLPKGWSASQSLARVNHQLRSLLACRDLSAGTASMAAIRDLGAWLHCRPADLDAPQLEAAVVLRALLAEPVLVVIDPSWDAWGGAIRLLEDARWWMPVGNSSSLPDSTWSNVSLDHVLRSLS